MRTLEKESETVLIEKKSRFIGYAKAAGCEEEAQAFIQKIKKRHWDATHNVYAYQIGPMNEKQKSTDDGEPAGTAGRPVLETIKKAGLHNAVLVVTRYFGGVLLGTGGLVRAYTKAARAAIEAAGIVELQPGQKFCLIMEYTLLGKVQNDLAARQIAIEKIDYQNNAAVYCLIAAEDGEQFMTMMKDTYAGQVKVMPLTGAYWLKKQGKQYNVDF